jgi:hypothetical protein
MAHSREELALRLVGVIGRGAGLLQLFAADSQRFIRRQEILALNFQFGGLFFEEPLLVAKQPVRLFELAGPRAEGCVG